MQVLDVANNARLVARRHPRRVRHEPARRLHFEIYTMTAAGGTQTRLTNNTTADSSPDWS